DAGGDLGGVAGLDLDVARAGDLDPQRPVDRVRHHVARAGDGDVGGAGDVFGVDVARAGDANLQLACRADARIARAGVVDPQLPPDVGKGPVAAAGVGE